MTDNSISGITFMLEVIGISLLALTILLILIRIGITLLRRLARLQVSRTDLDLIGVVATVTHAIRPRRPGKIRYQTTNGEFFAEAVSDKMIRSGQTVLITAINHGTFRVLPHSDESSPTISAAADSHLPMKPTVAADDGDPAAKSDQGES